ncbi:MAG TPA: hypothetical protein DEG17_17835 [Cyanobacteria bacterium UBA11149]|nr:hypothetical protein [Cyanobacteria bacterium UBA11159]HBW90681.1 hypothetical protein [Cyanobacteria bacterium UBA11149]HCA97178.1 hypothetical protein [Cyanobacteria bacterium UBA9226]
MKSSVTLNYTGKINYFCTYLRLIYFVSAVANKISNKSSGRLETYRGYCDCNKEHKPLYPIKKKLTPDDRN